MFFQTGPTERGQEVLVLLAQEVGKLPNTVLIEGHPDAKPYSGGFYDNWELSAGRATPPDAGCKSAGGLRRDQVAQARGFADQHLRTPKDPMNTSNLSHPPAKPPLSGETAKAGESQPHGEAEHGG